MPQLGIDEKQALVSFKGPAGLISTTTFAPTPTPYHFEPYRSGAHLALYWALAEQQAVEVTVTVEGRMELMIATEMSATSITLAPVSSG